METEEQERIEGPQVVNMAIVERDDRLIVLMPKGIPMDEVRACHERMVDHGWPAERVTVMSGPEGFAVLKGGAAGPCMAQEPPLFTNTVGPSCRLLAGHAGGHVSDGGTQWISRD